MKRMTQAAIMYDTPQVTIVNLLTESVCLSVSAESGSNFDDMFETDSEWAGLK